MTTQEFSNAFDTLLNSYNSLAQFGELTSKADIVLDEYEKSVILTLALDIVVKLYFDKNNNLGLGIDDSSRRQMDFSSLITVAKLSPVPPLVTIYQSGTHTPSSEDVVASTGLTFYTAGSSAVISIDKIVPSKYPLVTTNAGLSYTISNLEYLGSGGGIITEESAVVTGLPVYTASSLSIGFKKLDTYDDRGTLYQVPTKTLLILNEQIKGILGSITRNYVVVPIHYQEYDKLMFKPYNQPLKKQCWRLFLNNGNDTFNELIPIDGVSILSYTIRYIRRPRPIVLTDLSVSSLEVLDIDGVSTITECELNPIMHVDILNKAIELTISTRLHTSLLLTEPNNR